MAIVLLASAVGSVLVLRGNTNGTIANIYQDGNLIHSVDLSSVITPQTLEFAGAVTNTVAIERGRIRIVEATCPDQICVHQGWISTGVAPIVCLPNSLVIRVERTTDENIDAIAR